MDTSAILRIPVSPYIGKYEGVEDVVLSLVGTVPAANIRLPSPPQAGLPLRELDMRLSSTDISVLVDLGFGTMISTRISSNVHYFLLDLVLSTQVPCTDPASIFASVEYGVGFRIAISAFDIDGGVKLELGALAAAATLNMAQTSFEMVAVGGGLAALAATQPLIASFGAKYDVATLDALAVVRQSLFELYASKGSSMQPQLIAVTVDPAKLASVLSGNLTTSMTDLLRGEVYATNRAYGSNNTLVEALAMRSHGDWNLAPQAIVERTYRQVFGVKDTDRPLDDGTIAERVRLIYGAGT